MQLTRFAHNPILAPTESWWEIKATFNPGVALFAGKVHLLYRAIGGDNLSRFGLALSSNGIDFERLTDPIFESETANPDERLGVEDARITKIDDTYYVVYTAASVYPAIGFSEKNLAPSLFNPAPWKVRPYLLTTRDFKSFERKGKLLDLDTKDACLLPEKVAGYFILYHRLYPDVYFTYSKDLKDWAESRKIFSPRSNLWDSERVGIGPPPIRTEKGWLSFYHGADQDHRYQLGVIIFDLKDPTKILYRSEKPILSPEEDYEKVGITPNVVFTGGAIEKNGQYFVYYGAADKVIGLATIGKQELLNSLNP